MSHSRRAFLQQASAAAVMGLGSPLIDRRLWRYAPAEFLTDPDETLLRELALKAVDAARAAGATFADIRLTIGRTIGLEAEYNRGQTPRGALPSLETTASCGVRALVDGAWGFAMRYDLTVDTVVAAAQGAVAGARANRPRHARRLDLAPVPRVPDGRWETPIEQDPFSVPFRDQHDLMIAALAELEAAPEVFKGGLQFEWRRPIQVFASTDGTLILQRPSLAWPRSSFDASVDPTNYWAGAGGGIPGLRVGGYGYEAIGAATLVERAREGGLRVAERARTQEKIVPQTIDVGRYDIVFGGSASCSLVVATLAEALNVERALGYEANRGGTSFAAPPIDMLGKYQIASRLVTLTGDRTQPHGAATTGWDDEGAPADTYPLVKDGVIVDYHTTRQTAMELADWYRSRGEPVRSHACARNGGMGPPVVRLPNLTLEPSRDDTSVEDLIAGTKRGLYITGTSGEMDQQVITGQWHVSHKATRVITNGKLGDYVKDTALQFVTAPFWKSVDGIGGAASSWTVPSWTESGSRTDAFPLSTIRAVPIRVRQVNVINTGRTA